MLADALDAKARGPANAFCQLIKGNRHTAIASKLTPTISVFTSKSASNGFRCPHPNPGRTQIPCRSNRRLRRSRSGGSV